MAANGGLGKPFNWPLIIGLWAFVSIGLILRHVLRADELPFFTPDDAMRMASVLDLANGQHWQDLVQHRDNVPRGALMHWSRLVDAPIAGLYLLLRPWLGATGAADAVAMTWPMLLALPLILLSLALTRRLVGPEGDLPAIVLPMLTMVLLVEFMPGRVDHHNVQILLTGALAWATIAGRTGVGAAIAAGLIAATSIAIGEETLHLIAASIVLFGLFWMADPCRSAAPVRAFAVALAGFTLLHFLLATPPSRYLARDCDALSITFVVATAAAGGGLLLATLIGGRLQQRWQRLVLLGLFGTASIGLATWFAPDCLRGPYAHMDPAIAELLFPTVKEARPVWLRFMQAPATTFTIVGVAPIALGLTAWIAWRETGGRRADWLVLLAFAAMALLITLFQLRGARLTPLLAIPAGAWLIAVARRRYQQAPKAGPAALLVLSWVLFTTTLHFAAVRLLDLAGVLHEEVPDSDPIAHARTACFQRQSYEALAALPPGRVIIIPMVIASNVLYFTPHSVVGTGFHRNEEGTRDNVRFFNGGEATARAIARDRDLDYLVLCKGLPEIGGLEPAAPDSIAAGTTWNWLDPLSSPEADLQIFIISKQAGS